DPVAFAAGRAELLSGLTRRVATSPTALVDEAEAAGGPLRPDAEPVIDPPEPAGGEAVGGVPVRRRPAPSGAAIGSAVHRVLELVALRGPSEQEIRRLAALACAEQEIPSLAEDVATRVGHALTARLVSEAAARGRFWREVYVVTPDGERYLEGYIDLLAEDEDGGPVVIDYKTDRVRGDAEIAAKTAHYRSQLQAYARALAGPLDREVSKGALVFAGPDGVRQVLVDLG
ncbi:MAG TPA: PD-(D/E)XK nuclease family protein, partial [Candidatus Eisenbacteria bacterium]|nr:PD-(D/E)XK nuclease family protein [Candidatus Eisenbacteria bacterium]